MTVWPRLRDGRDGCAVRSPPRRPTYFRFRQAPPARNRQHATPHLSAITAAGGSTPSAVMGAPYPRPQRSGASSRRRSPVGSAIHSTRAGGRRRRVLEGGPAWRGNLSVTQAERGSIPRPSVSDHRSDYRPPPGSGEHLLHVRPPPRSAVPSRPGTVRRTMGVNATTLGSVRLRAVALRSPDEPRRVRAASGDRYGASHTPETGQAIPYGGELTAW